ncbi:unnamed protein product [Spirodela intermedia]|uniref:Uncharacterized protein n=1 Tax=Spirodela intermedia TaxID=51605 RepID=A0A7I8KYQ3_SPIIN|nr:unnamed protein product [Spirodela intermedia]
MASPATVASHGGHPAATCSPSVAFGRNWSGVGLADLSVFR